MRFSIITATKNNKLGLLRTIECLRNQTYKKIEHIVVDGGSTDGSVEILRQAQDDNPPTSQYSLITMSEPDSGIYDAINKGIKLATGEVIGLLHSDDLYADKNVIEEYAEVFSNNNVNAVYSDLVYVKQKQEVRSKKSELELPTNYSLLTTNYSIIRYWKSQKKEFSNVLQRNRAIKFGWMPPHPTLFVRREIFNKYGLYRTDMKIAADYEMILRLFHKCKINSQYLPLTSYLMSIGGASNKNLFNIIQKSKEDLRAMKLNGISFPALTLFYKNITKVPQFLVRGL